jgi:hypothetical protein
MTGFFHAMRGEDRFALVEEWAEEAYYAEKK